MKKRLMIGLAAGALVAAMVPGIAQANGPVGTCPDDFDLTNAGDTDPTVPGRNGDGWLCFKRLVNGTVLVIDNNIPIRD